MNVPLLQVRKLNVVPPGSRVPVCTDISFSLDGGERLALVGASGAGKTTLLRAINGSMPAQSGEIVIAGRTLRSRSQRELRALRRLVALIPQKHDLVDSLRVYQNVMAGALGRWSNAHALRFLFWPLSSELEEAREALERVSLSDKLRARASKLSGGQQQRVAIARALVQRPLLILADEPVASLDTRMAHQVLDLLCRLAGHDGVGLICTLHQPKLAAEYFPRILEMSAGRLADETGAESEIGPKLPEPVQPAQRRALRAL